MGLFLEGIFLAGEPRQGKDGFYVSICCGIDTYKVSVPDIPQGLTFGDSVKLAVRPSVFNGRMYISGEFVGKGV